MVRQELIDELITTKDKRLNIRVSEPYLKRLNLLKAKSGVCISEMIRRGLILYLDRNEI